MECLRLKVHPSPDYAGPDLGSQNSWNSVKIGYIEAKLKLQDYEDRPCGCQCATLGHLQDYQWWISCDVLIELNLPNEGYARCDDGELFPNGTVTGDYDTSSIPIKPDEWQLVRIEIEPEAFRLNFYLNGEIIGTMIPAEAHCTEVQSSDSSFWHLD